jgi:SAM-dependent methyltransferase
MLCAMPGPHQDIVSLFSRAAPSYDAVGPRFFTYFAGRLVSRVGVPPGSDVLDVATGTGAVLLQAARLVGDQGRVVGIDLTQAMLDRAADEIERRSIGRAELRVMDAEGLEFMDASFDCVFCAFTLPILSDPALALAGFHRVLRPGGRLGLANTFGWFHQHDERWGWEGELLQAFGASDALRAPRVGLAQLEEMARHAGFTQLASVEETFVLVFRDAHEWWDWAWSHGYRRLLESVEPNRLTQLKRALFDGLADRRAPDGRIYGSITANLTSARA